MSPSESLPAMARGSLQPQGKMSLAPRLMQPATRMPARQWLHRSHTCSQTLHSLCSLPHWESEGVSFKDCQAYRW